MSLSLKALTVPVCFLLFLCVSALSRGENVSFPAPAESILSGGLPAKKSSGPEVASAAPKVFSIGDPSDEEQLYLELINRARSNPNTEVQRLIGLNDQYVQNALRNVNTNLLVSQF